MTTLDIEPDPALWNKQALERIRIYREGEQNERFQPSI